MIIPQKIRVGGITFDVIEKDIPEYGQTTFSNQEIALRKSQREDQKAETLLHEVMHIVCVQSGLSERLGNKDTVKLTEEEIVRALTPLLHTALVDNQLAF